MGREVRHVPATWEHPCYPADHYEPRLQGKYVPLHQSGRYAEAAQEWDEEFVQWQQGFRRSYASGDKWVPKSDETGRYTEYAGSRPSPDDYMPDWPEAERTHLMMYEDTTEGTPISPAFATPEELARWLADNNASSFGDSTATYEQWLSLCNRGWAPSMVVSGGQIMSGVEFMADDAP